MYALQKSVSKMPKVHFLRALQLLVFASSLFAVSPGAAAQSCNAGVQYFTHGNYTTAALFSDGKMSIDLDSLVTRPGQPGLAKRAFEARFLSQDTINNNILYLETPSKRILFDAGNSHIAGEGGLLPENLAAQGIPPESITDVLITHAHPDHIGGLVLDANFTLAFPEATVYLSRMEFEYWYGALEGVPLNTSDIEPELLALAIELARDILDEVGEGLELFEFTDEVLPGITAINTPYHTPGHAVFKIDGGPSHPPLNFLGDAVIGEVMGIENPYLEVFGDGNRTAGPMGRVALLDEVADAKELIASSHSTFPGLGYIVHSGVFFEVAPVALDFTVAATATCPVV